MRKTLTGLGLAFFLTLGPAAAAATDSLAAPVTQSQPTPAPQNNSRDSGDKTGLWGLAGLIGLLGLGGLRKHREYTGTGSGAHVGDRPTRP
ncbi:WGxxGxxG family protein [Streptosporangium sp. NPDC020072]|uniref:WGxxGxxG family protein n=1 Tax=Streptosporangium jomthongense TaxID=1193683 RepID=A0ABV8F4Q0_9ACTN